MDGVVYDIPVRNFNAEIGLSLGSLEDKIASLSGSSEPKAVFRQIEILFEMIGICVEDKEHWIPWLKSTLPMNSQIIQQFFEELTSTMLSNDNGSTEKKNGARKRSKPTEKQD